MKKIRRLLGIAFICALGFYFPTFHPFITNNILNNTSAEKTNIHLSSYKNSDPIIIIKDSDFTSLGLTGTGILEDPFLIEGLKIVNSNSNLISVINTTAYFIIINNFLDSKNSQNSAIHISSTANGIIKNNIIKNSETGINIASSDKIVIIQNSVEESSVMAIHIENSNGNTLSLNDISENGIGISFERSSRNILANNNLRKNNEYGVKLNFDSFNNTVAWNNFVENNLESNSQALDDGSSNVFVGNYWNEWISPDEDSNGIVDQVYNIDGQSDNVDEFPQMLSNDLIPNIRNSSSNSFFNFLTDSNSFVLSFLAVGIIGIGMISFKGILLMLRKIKMNRLIKDVSVDLIGYSSPIIISLIKGSEDPDADIDESYPPELLNYKFILNPVRLTILKLLIDYTTYPSYLVREILGISWGSFSGHIEVLVKNNLIISKEEFIDGSPKQVLYLEVQGITIYNKLQQLLKKMFDLK
ncbi:MAG: hypothetical protein HeimC2_36890 [Candidatus Heimdallarchaeota archaeon LC_2]|nr:MAG: hypothetical protein HeimC2_44860 [Candidatus Heimdallarchaeota archaeon LC_2]OLS20531.1 MAG: hypothetical protein HeimC2_36890 [Candidatus Heimdallarchaeota archaeon LC_2]